MTTAEFQHVFLKNAALPKSDAAGDILNQYIQTRSKALGMARELGVGSVGCNEVCATAADAFVKRWMMLEFAWLDTSFLKSTWFVHVTRDNGDAPAILSASVARADVELDPVTSVLAETRRFMSVEVDASDFVYGSGLAGLPKSSQTQRRWREDDDLEIATMSSGRRKKDSYRTVELRFSAALPDGVCNRHITLARRAMSHLHLAVALCYRHGIDIRGEMREPQNGSRETKVQVVWAPLAEALVVSATPPRPKGDPAVLYKINGLTFLLDFYDTPDEAPIEHLIREFSEGDLRRAS